MLGQRKNRVKRAHNTELGVCFLLLRKACKCWEKFWRICSCIDGGPIEKILEANIKLNFKKPAWEICNGDRRLFIDSAICFTRSSFRVLRTNIGELDVLPTNIENLPHSI